MRKILVASLLLVTILLSACGNKTATTTAPIVTPTVQPTQGGALPGQCQLAPSILQAQPSSALTAPEPSSTDHIEGPSSAVMTVIEYSDFT